MKIPRNLKPGDRLWYSETGFATVADRIEANTPYYNDGHIHSLGIRGGLYVYNTDGREFGHDTPPIIRIERMKSAPKRKAATKSEVWWGYFNFKMLCGVSCRRKYAWAAVRDRRRWKSDREMRRCFIVRKVTVTWEVKP